jgi:hypothetical protein
MLGRRGTPGVVKQEPAAEDEGARNPYAYKENAPPQKQRGKNVVNDSQYQACNSNRLTNVDYFATSTSDMRKAVKVGIVETNLHCNYYDQDLHAKIGQPNEAVKLGRIPQKPQFGPAEQAADDQDIFQKD